MSTISSSDARPETPVERWRRLFPRENHPGGQVFLRVVAEWRPEHVLEGFKFRGDPQVIPPRWDYHATIFSQGLLPYADMARGIPGCGLAAEPLRRSQFLDRLPEVAMQDSRCSLRVQMIERLRNLCRIMKTLELVSPCEPERWEATLYDDAEGGWHVDEAGCLNTFEPTKAPTQ